MDSWDQFADNLATDLAPFISLFGERLTKQFLSESVSLLDNFIFSLAPLGILTALVSVIRVCGSSSLRAFVGRAQEGPGEAENELLSCVSETTGELFNDTGISRIFGRPRILEVVVWEEHDPQNNQRRWKIGTLRDALQHGAWVPGSGSWILDEKGYLPELDIPNLSLNKGIKRRSPVWFYCAAALGLVLQVGVIITKRIGPEQNRFDGQERQLVSYKSQELDFFAFHLENAESFSLVSTLGRTPSSSSQSSLRSSNATTEASVQPVGNATRLIKTRTRLAELTSANDRNSSAAWDDLPIRQIARSLADAIEQTMDLLSAWKSVRDDHFAFDLSLLCQSQHKSIAPMMETYTIALERADDTLQWRVNENELEAIVGLWTWSLLKSDPKWLQEGLGRMVGLTEFEARAPDTDLYFHKWIFRQTEARMVSSRMVSFPQQLFGYYSDEYPDDKEILVVRTKNKLEKMVAQDIYIHFLRSALEGLAELGGEINILPGSQNRLVAHNSRIDDIVECFESSGLGSREDALLCVVPSLRNRGLLPELAADSHPIRLRLEELIGSKKWSEALSITYWFCERSAGDEFEYSAYELGYLCHLAMIDQDASAQAEGMKFVKLAMQGNPRTLFFRNMRNQRPLNWMDTPEQADFWARFTQQLGWMVWHISEQNGQKQVIRAALAYHGINEDSLPLSGDNGHDVQGQKGQETVVRWLTNRDENQSLSTDDRQALSWACRDGHHAILNWVVAKWVDIDKLCHGGIIFNFIIWAAEEEYDVALASLRRRGIDLDMQGPVNGMTAIIFSIFMHSNYKAARVLLDNGAHVDAPGKKGITPLMVASDVGLSEAVLLFLENNANVNAQDIEGVSPLVYAIVEGQFNIAETLLKNGADINSRDINGVTPLMVAADEKEVELLRLLLSWGADVNAQDDDGRTALMITAQSHCRDGMVALLNHGADVHRQTTQRETALDWAQNARNWDGVRLLRSVIEGQSASWQWDFS
ncbi:hypothetical protein HFD88_002970 [Aspergillus terreus]|nr:hypothetical protein HFD88_002970 [Aspergillus terreus]